MTTEKKGDRGTSKIEPLCPQAIPLLGVRGIDRFPGVRLGGTGFASVRAGGGSIAVWPHLRGGGRLAGALRFAGRWGVTEVRGRTVRSTEYGRAQRRGTPTGGRVALALPVCGPIEVRSRFGRTRAAAADWPVPRASLGGAALRRRAYSTEYEVRTTRTGVERRRAREGSQYGVRSTECGQQAEACNAGGPVRVYVRSTEYGAGATGKGVERQRASEGLGYGVASTECGQRAEACNASGPVRAYSTKHGVRGRGADYGADRTGYGRHGTGDGERIRRAPQRGQPLAGPATCLQSAIRTPYFVLAMAPWRHPPRASLRLSGVRPSDKGSAPPVVGLRFSRKLCYYEGVRLTDSTAPLDRRRT